MTHSNVKEFGEEDSTLNHVTFLSKNLDHLKEPPTDKGFSKLSLPVLRLLSVQMSELMSEDHFENC